MNTEPMISVPRSKLALACMLPSKESIDKNQQGIIERGRAQEELRALLAQPEAKPVIDYGSMTPVKRLEFCRGNKPGEVVATFADINIVVDPNLAPGTFTYSSRQATNCAGCGLLKHTPLRVDEMGGYVCLTCIDKQLDSFYAERSAPIQVAAVAAVVEDDDGPRLDWLLEGGINEAGKGALLLIADREITDDEGAGVVRRIDEVTP